MQEQAGQRDGPVCCIMGCFAGHRLFGDKPETIVITSLATCPMWRCQGSGIFKMIFTKEST
jgi:hypothetical protein